MNRIVRRIAELKPRTIALLGWLGMVLYAFPGYMSYDSVRQLQQARWNLFVDSHPPAMAFLWRHVENVIRGPAGMLLLQTACFQLGGYLLLRTRMSGRKAAVLATLIMWYPPISNTLGVIWKDSQMGAYLMLGAGMLVSQRRGVRVGGLVMLLVATTMRYNALAMTLPIVVVLFVWNPAHGFIKRHAIAIAAWVAITLSAGAVNSALTDQHRYVWHQSLALLDIVGTLRNVPDMPDAEIAQLLDGIPYEPHDQLHHWIKTTWDPTKPPTDILWDTTDRFFFRGDFPDAKERAAITRAWKAVVFGHPREYLAYRSVVFAQLVQLDGTELGSPIYFWFTDIQDLEWSAGFIEHDAWPSRSQDLLHHVMYPLGDTPLFHVGLYLILAVLLLPFAWGDRPALAMIGSALSGELALFFLSPTVDVRYSFWLFVGTVCGLILIVARRVAKYRAKAA